MTSAAVFLVLLAPLAFVGVAAVAATHPGGHPVLVERLGAIASWFGVLVAAVAGLVVAVDGVTTSTTLGWNGLGISLRLDPLSAVMFAMISLLAVVIVRYSATYLDGDERQGVFLGRLAATIAAVEVLVLSGNLAVLVLAWILTSLALHELLVFYRDRPRAVLAAHKKFLVARIGDVFLIVAAVLLYREFGTGDLGEIFSGVGQAVNGGWALGAVSVAALCLAVAALLKSAQFPTHGWLVEVMETPTPVSALLHAGILNAGPFLAIRMAFVLDAARPATLMLLVVGGFTAIFASVVLLSQPSVKVALAYSSAAHMGFMLMVCGMGLYPAALLHLVAHSFYKAHAFLSSGSVVDERRAAKVTLPEAPRQPAAHRRQRRRRPRPLPPARAAVRHRLRSRSRAAGRRWDPRHRHHPAGRAGARLHRWVRRDHPCCGAGARRDGVVLRARSGRPRVAREHPSELGRPGHHPADTDRVDHRGLRQCGRAPDHRAVTGQERPPPGHGHPPPQRPLRQRAARSCRRRATGADAEPGARAMSPTATSPEPTDTSGDLTVDLTDALTPSTEPQGADAAVRAACRRIAPLWPLESFVAVNPYLGLVDRPFAEVAELLAGVAGAQSTLGVDFYLDAVGDGRITTDGPRRRHGGGRSFERPRCRRVPRFGSRAGTDDPLSRRVPTVAAVATAATGHDWDRFSIDRISAWAAAYFDEGQALWRSADRDLPSFVAWKEEASIDRTPEVMGLRGFRASVRSMPDEPVAAIARALDRLAVPAEATELYLHAAAPEGRGLVRVRRPHRLGPPTRPARGRHAGRVRRGAAGWEVGLLEALSGEGVETAWAEVDARDDRPRPQRGATVPGWRGCSSCRTPSTAPSSGD